MIAVLDANVLYPAPLRDVLMWLTTVKAYEPRWTEEIHAEWIRNVLAASPDVTSAQLERTRRLMDQIDPKSMVSGYEAHIPPSLAGRGRPPCAGRCLTKKILGFSV